MARPTARPIVDGIFTKAGPENVTVPQRSALERVPGVRDEIGEHHATTTPQVLEQLRCVDADVSLKGERGFTRDQEEKFVEGHGCDRKV
jgi:hypothetical protein